MKTNSLVARLYKELGQLGNDVFKTREYKKFLSLPLTRRRAAYYIFERSHFHLNRRECWALVQARSPFDVKQLIWHHEMEELQGDKERGVENHLVLGMKEGDAVGLKPRDFKKAPSEGTLICTYAWSHIAEHAPWLEALASSCMLEIANSDGIVRGGGIANRFGKKMARELKIPLSRQPSNKEHMEAEITHANLLFETGPIADRSKEYLGTSDSVVTRFRKYLLEALKDHANGMLPFGVGDGIDYSAIRALAIRYPADTDWREPDLFNPPEYTLKDIKAAE